jgi:hypothetical protein
MHQQSKQKHLYLVMSYIGTLEIGFSVGSSVDVNDSALPKRILLYALNTDPDFDILPFQGRNQNISYPNGIPTTKYGVDLYFQHNTVKYGVRGKITVTMSNWVDQMKDMGPAFRTYLNKEKV